MKCKTKRNLANFYEKNINLVLKNALKCEAADGKRSKQSFSFIKSKSTLTAENDSFCLCLRNSRGHRGGS